MDAFAERYFPVGGQEFVSRDGTWRSELDGPVEVSGPDRRIFHLRFNLTTPDARWKGPAASVRKLELRTSLASFHGLREPVADMASVNRIEAADHFPSDYPDYSNWLRFVIDSFLEADKADDMIEAYETQRGVNTLTRVKNIVGKHGHLAVPPPVRDRVTFLAVVLGANVRPDTPIQDAISQSEFTVSFDNGDLVDGSNTKVISGFYISDIDGMY